MARVESSIPGRWGKQDREQGRCLMRASARESGWC
jgi:hypothetical protein